MRIETKRGRGPRLHELVPNRIADKIVHPGTVPEPNFGLRRVDVDVHLSRIAVEEEERERETRRRHQIVIPPGDGVEYQAIPNQPPVDKNEDRIPVVLLDLWARHEASQGVRSRFIVGILGGRRAVFAPRSINSSKIRLPNT